MTKLSTYVHLVLVLCHKRLPIPPLHYLYIREGHTTYYWAHINLYTAPNFNNPSIVPTAIRAVTNVGKDLHLTWMNRALLRRLLCDMFAPYRLTTHSSLQLVYLFRHYIKQLG